jgi:ParB family transcriptional regulator, chromosome partitioning protein
VVGESERLNLLTVCGGSMIHQLKIKQCYLFHILEGKKTFEVRKNDRDFQVGDIIKFLPLEDENYDVYTLHGKIPDYQINYILSNFSGLQQGHVCMAITPLFPMLKD